MAIYNSNGQIIDAVNEKPQVTGLIANEYDAASTYAVGDYASHEGKVYKCKTAITTAEEFDTLKWDEVVVGDEIGEIKGNLKCGVYIENSDLIIENVKNLFDLKTIARNGSIYIGSTTPSVYANSAFYQSNPIKTTPGETIILFGQMNNTTDFWASVLRGDDASELSDVIRCVRIYPTEAKDGKSYIEYTIPDDAEWMSFSGLISNISIATISRPIGDRIYDIEYDGVKIPISTQIDTTFNNEGEAPDAYQTGQRLHNIASHEHLNYLDGNILHTKKTEPTNLFDKNNYQSGFIYTQTSTNPSKYTNANWNTTNAISVTPGEYIEIYGVVPHTVSDIWVSVLNANDSSQLSNVVRAFRVIRQETINNNFVAIIQVPENANYMAFSFWKGLNNNVRILRMSDLQREGKSNLFDASTSVHEKLYVQGTNAPAIYTPSGTNNWCQTNAISVTPGEYIEVVDNVVPQTVDVWVSALNSADVSELSSVDYCFRIKNDNARLTSGIYHSIFKVPEDVALISISYAVYKETNIKIYRRESASEIYHFSNGNELFNFRDGGAIRFDRVVPLRDEEKSIARTNIGALGQELTGSYVTPQMYGATGNGTTDDSDAIQEAINSLSGWGMLYIPRGRYKITKTINVNNRNIFIHGDGNMSCFVPDDSITGGVFNVTQGIVRFTDLCFATAFNPDQYAIVLNNTEQIVIEHVDILGGSFRETTSKCVKQTGDTWSTLMIYHCVWDCGAISGWAIELINTSASPRICDVHIDDVFLDTVNMHDNAGGCLRVDNCDDVHIQNSLYRTYAGVCAQLDTGGRMINEMSVLETFAANKPAVVINAGVFQNRGGWNKDYDPA